MGKLDRLYLKESKHFECKFSYKGIKFKCKFLIFGILIPAWTWIICCTYGRETVNKNVYPIPILTLVLIFRLIRQLQFCPMKVLHTVTRLCPTFPTSQRNSTTGFCAQSCRTQRRWCCMKRWRRSTRLTAWTRASTRSALTHS